MKKFITFLLILALSVSMVACGDKEEPTDNGGAEDGGISETITVQVEEDWMPHYEKAKDRVLETYPDAEIELMEVSAFDHLDVLDATDITNEDVADVFAIPADRVYGLAQNEALAGLDAKKMAENVGGFDNYDDGLGGNFQIDGDYLSFPMNIETLILFANKANAEDNDIDLEGEIEFTELGAEDMLIPVFDAWFGVAMTNSAEIELLGKTDSDELFTDLTEDWDDLPEEKQNVFEALFEYWKAHDELGTSMWDVDAAFGYMDEAFETGENGVLRLEGPWSTGSLSEQAGDGEDLEILPINTVTVAGKPLAHWQGGWGMSINSRNEDNEDKMILGEKFIEEVVNTEYAVDFFESTGKILENVAAEDYEASDLSDTDKKVISSVIESYKIAPARPLFLEWGQVWDSWENSIISWASTKPQSAEDAYNEVKASFEAMMVNF